MSIHKLEDGRYKDPVAGRRKEQTRARPFMAAAILQKKSNGKRCRFAMRTGTST